MKNMIRSAAFAFAMIVAGGGTALATFPERPIRIVVGFPSGIGMEVNTRILADLAAKAAGTSIVIENRPGASGIIAANAVLQASKDGYTMLMLNNQHYANQLLFTRRPYKTEDFIPVSGGGTVTMVLAASKSFPAATVADLIAYAKAHPDEVPFGHWGVGGSAYLLPKKFEADKGLKLKEIPYKDSGQLMSDLLAGRISLFFTSLTQILPSVTNGDVKLLAISSTERLPSLPNVPTFAESGITGMPSPWWGYGVPAGTPPDVVNKLHNMIYEATKSPHYKERLSVSGAEPLMTETPEKFRQFVAEQNDLWDSIIRKLDIHIDN